MSIRISKGQLSFDLFPVEEKPSVLTEEGAVAWLKECYGCTEEVRGYVRGLFAEFSPSSAFERCKVLPTLNGKRKLDGWELSDAIDYYEIYSHEIGYHTVWDRAWAARKGYTKIHVLNLEEWDFKNDRPIWKDWL